jgi:1-deoxy-D-xylulose-5-phosphate reductoisomerase
MKKITLAGSTGSIGENTLAIVRKHSDRLKVVALSAGSNWKKISAQAREFKPEMVAIRDENAYLELKNSLSDTNIQVFAGEDAIIQCAKIETADCMVAAIVGSAGLKPVMAAIESGKEVCLANKETLVVGGEVVTRAVKEKGVSLIPIDSEHSAIFQCLQNSREFLRRIIITASGGPFKDFSVEKLSSVSVEQALKHPNWNMGGKITIDSATLMNKGLEVIEAHWLFEQAYENIDVVVHPQSIVHSLVEFSDGSVIAQLGWPDMKLPIQYALSFPQRWEKVGESLDLIKIGKLDFCAPDFDKFPCLKLAFEAGKTGGTAPCILNAANEIAVQAFLEQKIEFNRIPVIVERTLEHFDFYPVQNIDQLLEIDKLARIQAEEMIGEY